MTDEELLKARDEAWIEYTDFNAQIYRPRYYKHKVGKKKGFINPWQSEEERLEVRAVMLDKEQKWFKYHCECVARDLLRIDLHILNRWIIQDTPDGERYVRK